MLASAEQVDHLVVRQEALAAQLGAVMARIDDLVRGVEAAVGRPLWPDELTTSQATVFAGVSRMTLYRLLESGRLTDVRGPRRWLRAELEAVRRGVPMGRR